MAVQLDFLVVGASVFDGVREEARQVAVGVRGEEIAYVGTERPPADIIIEAAGLYLCPGFIDTHASTGLGYRFPHAGDNKLLQGVTTEIIGNCGTSTAPVGERLVPTMHKLASETGFRFDWRSMKEWMEGVRAHGLPFNVGTYVGHSTLRGGVCADMEYVTPLEMDVMKELLDEAMGEGALGLSSGLVYAPGSFAGTGELIELAKVVARHGGIYASHIRSERQELEAAVEEAITIGREAGIPVLISHLKAAERPNWGKIPSAIELVEAARAEGQPVSFEVYPYTATSTKLRTFIPKAIMNDGVSGMVNKLRTPDWRERSVAWLLENDTLFDGMVMITDSLPGAAGQSIQQLAQTYSCPPAHMVVDILLEDPEAWIIYHCIDETDMDTAILWPDANICSDSWSYPVNAPNPIGQPHPRTYGAFTRFLERYALREPRLPFGEAVRKITALPADVVGLAGRGRIAEGYAADLVCLDPAAVKENATYSEPRQFSSGTVAVWVNGQQVVAGGELLDVLPGQFVRRAHD